MYLKRLEIQGFKSFANKTTLDFETGMTAVVGPNGSGKSNIADAIRWVLGEQSSKQLRGKKSEDVIFAGSEKKGRLSFAEVSVTFDNADHRIPVDYAEVAITRRIDRSGESDYLINGNKVRLLDIVDLILKSNIGTSRYTVIGQGTIDQMILAGPSEIKNLIDEASGVKTYYMRREKTLKRLEQTTQNLIRVQDLLREIEPRLKSLRRQAKRMEEREAIERDLKLVQSEFYAGTYVQLHQLVEVATGTIEAYSIERQKIDNEITEIRAALDASEHGNRDEIIQYQQIQQEIRSMQDRKNRILEDAAMVRGKLQANTAAVGNTAELQLEQSRLQAEAHQLQQRIEQANSQMAELTVEGTARRSTFEQISTRLADLQKTLDRPRDLTSTQFAEELNSTDALFEEYYAGLQSFSSIEQVREGAERLRGQWKQFKERAVRFVQDPYEEFDRQREALQQILRERDAASAELNRFDLQISKQGLDKSHFEQELATIERRLLQISLDLQHADSADTDSYLRDLAKSESQLNAEVALIAGEISQLEERISLYHAGEQSRKHVLLETERRQRLLQDEISKLRDAESKSQVQKAVLDTQMQTMLNEAQAALGADRLNEILNSEDLSVFADSRAMTERESKIARFKSQLQMIGGIDELTIREYQETETRYTYLHAQIADLEKGIADLRAVIDELDGHIKKRFQGAFEQIDEKFQNYFRILFNGGRAYLTLIKAKDANEQQVADQEQSGELEEVDDLSHDSVAASGMRPEEKVLQKYEQGNDLITGIDIKATPPGKKLAAISALSGGERALTSIALLCALLTCFPSPFVVLDEVDAALDEANTVRFAQILGKISDQTQFVTVTHNRETMREAHTLYGVTMGDDSVSKVLSLKMEQAQAYAK
jgi:chromosome segregation protein